jgi:hypothetical protein
MWVLNLQVISVSEADHLSLMLRDDKHQQTGNEKGASSSRFKHEQQALKTDFTVDASTVVASSADAGLRSKRSHEEHASQKEMEGQEDVHLVFSTGCSVFQDWQSYGFFFQAWQSGHEGHVTRVASGCEEEDAQQLLLDHDRLIVKGMSDRFHLHLTPDYSKSTIPEKDYKFFNKPMGLRHWMENGLGFSANQSRMGTASKLEDTLFVILDPDQFVTQPFRREYGRDAQLWATTPSQAKVKIERGKPMAQLYGLGARWKENINATFILNSATAPSTLRSWNTEDILNHYSAGPPYMAMGSDMYKIVYTWAEMVVPVYHLTKTHLSEMIAYAVAAAHLNLPHQLSRTFMLSNAFARSESWAWVDEQRPVQVCQPQPAKITPLVIHYCQEYFLGPYYFFKYYVPKNQPAVFLSCEHELFAQPPVNDVIATKYNSSVTRDGKRHDLEPQSAQRMAYMLCQVLPRMNAIARHFKSQECPAGTANLNATFFFRPRKKN